MQEIEKLRAEMDQVHNELVRLFQKRLDITQKIWQIKKANQMPFLDPAREDLILQKIEKLTEDEDQKSFLTQIFKTVLVQTKIYLKAKLK